MVCCFLYIDASDDCNEESNDSINDKYIVYRSKLMALFADVSIVTFYEKTALWHLQSLLKYYLTLLGLL